MLVLELEQTFCWGQSSHHSPNQNSIVLIHIMGPNLWERQPRKGCDPAQGWIFPSCKLSLLPIPTELIVLALQTVAGCLHSSGVKERGQQGDCGMSSARGLVKSGEREPKGGIQQQPLPAAWRRVRKRTETEPLWWLQAWQQQSKIAAWEAQVEQEEDGLSWGGEYISEVVAALPALVAVTVLLHVGGETTGVLSLFWGVWQLQQVPDSSLFHLFSSCPLNSAWQADELLDNKMLKCSCLFLFEGRAAKALRNSW